MVTVVKAENLKIKHKMLIYSQALHWPTKQRRLRDTKQSSSKFNKYCLLIIK
jgi:hypothetical protein